MYLAHLIYVLWNLLSLRFRFFFVILCVTAEVKSPLLFAHYPVALHNRPERVVITPPLKWLLDARLYNKLANVDLNSRHCRMAGTFILTFPSLGVLQSQAGFSECWYLSYQVEHLPLIPRANKEATIGGALFIFYAEIPFLSKIPCCECITRPFTKHLAVNLQKDKRNVQF